MPKHDIMKKILLAVESLEDDLLGSNMIRVKKAEDAYLKLVDRFYEENQELLACQQYEAAKKDFEYFLRLLVLAMAYWEKENINKEMVQH